MQKFALIIYLGVSLRLPSCRLPSSIERELLISLVYLALHRIEFTGFHYSIICTYFLLHWSSIRIGWVLPTILRYGVQTFLFALDYMVKNTKR